MTADLDQLDTQQQLLTDSLARMLQGHWTGFPSLQADLEALSPGIELVPHPPVLTSDAGPEPPRYAWNPGEPQIPQLYSWTCSGCATEYVERAAGAARSDDIYANRDAVIRAIGYPSNVNEVYGLMDGSGIQLQRVLLEHAGIDTNQAWLSFDQAYAIYAQTFGLGSGGALYHWVAFAGVDGPNIAIRNSAEGYCGVYSTLSRAQWNQWGPWSCIYAV
jgi:hypothetical protein